MRMKSLFAFPLALAIAAAPGCKGDSEEPAEKTEAEKTEAARPGTAGGGSAAATPETDRETWVESMDRELEQLGDSIEALGDKIGDLPEVAQAQARPAVEALDDTIERLEDRVESAREAAPAEFKQIQNEVEQGMAEVQRQWKKALSSFETAAAPDGSAH